MREPQNGRQTQGDDDDDDEEGGKEKEKEERMSRKIHGGVSALSFWLPQVLSNSRQARLRSKAVYCNLSIARQVRCLERTS